MPLYVSETVDLVPWASLAAGPRSTSGLSIPCTGDDFGVSRRATGALSGALLLGIILRLLWPADMEYKGDEQFLFAHATGPHPFTWVGQASGAGTRNPGMGIWVYALLARVLSLTTPVHLVQAVMVINVLALLALAAFALKAVPDRQREPWLWATALLAVNPLAILFSRKLWVQCVLPPFSMAMLLGWWRRGTRAGAFAWGLVGAWLGQVHMSGFFLAGGFAAWTALFDRRSVRWRWWLAGSLVGAWTLVPWLVQVLGHHGSPARSLLNTVEPRFWAYWVSYPLGINLLSSFGHDAHQLLAWPTAGGNSTYLVGIALGLVIVCGLAIGVEAFALTVWPRRKPAAAPLGGRRSASGLSLGAGTWGFGVLITLSGVLIYRHYLIVTYALPFVCVAVAALLVPARGRRLLIALVLAEAALSVGYLTYIHDRGGAPRGDYGVAYDHQPSSRR